MRRILVWLCGILVWFRGFPAGICPAVLGDVVRIHAGYLHVLRVVNHRSVAIQILVLRRLWLLFRRCLFACPRLVVVGFSAADGGLDRSAGVPLRPGVHTGRGWRLPGRRDRGDDVAEALHAPLLPLVLWGPRFHHGVEELHGLLELFVGWVLDGRVERADAGEDRPAELHLVVRVGRVGEEPALLVGRLRHAFEVHVLHDEAEALVEGHAQCVLLVLERGRVDDDAGTAVAVQGRIVSRGYAVFSLHR